MPPVVDPPTSLRPQEQAVRDHESRQCQEQPPHTPIVQPSTATSNTVGSEASDAHTSTYTA